MGRTARPIPAARDAPSSHCAARGFSAGMLEGRSRRRKCYQPREQPPVFDREARELEGAAPARDDLDDGGGSAYRKSGQASRASASFAGGTIVTSESATAIPVTSDLSNTLTAMVGGPILCVISLWVCHTAGADATTTEAFSAIATALPASGLIIWRRLRSTPRDRAAAIAAYDLAMNPYVVAVLLGSFLVLADSLIGGAVRIIVGATAAGAWRYGVSSAGQHALIADGLGAAGVYVVLPGLLATAVFTARRAAHFIRRRKLLFLLVAAAIYWLLRMAIVGTRTRAIANLGFQQGMAVWAGIYGTVSVLLAIAMLLGALWSGGSPEAFVGQRLLAELDPDDRRAALALLRGEVVRQ